MDKIFEQRRKRFFHKLASMGESIAVIPAHPELIRNDDVHFSFRQDSSFFYLTGFHEPDSIAVFSTVGGKSEYIIFVRPKDLEKEIWTGYRLGVDAAPKELGANRAYLLDEFDKVFPKLLNGAENVLYSFYRTLNRNGVEYLDEKILRLVNEHRVSRGRTGQGIQKICDLFELLGELRVVKSDEEIEALRKAASISANAHKELMQYCKPGLLESEIEALFDFYCRTRGSKRNGYGSIVASGVNATILHYVDNDKKLKDGDLLLVDAGAEFNHYTADITRTFPINGKFSAEQKEIYQIVLDVQKQCVAMAKPGATMRSIHEFAVSELTDAMIKLKFIKDTKKKAIESLGYKRYYPHGTGHYLGLDVHDCGLYSKQNEPRKLEPGMVFTIEPGFYVLFDDMQVPEKYRGIGVRIEDDILITQDGHEVLTKEVPKEASEMASLIGTKKWPIL
ncbi:MAG: aminopeptidase P N-terminal domain-containing protein [Bacteriovoracia bacterium]